MVLTTASIAAVASLALTHFATGQSTSNQLGKVAFPTSCKPAAQAQFNCEASCQAEANLTCDPPSLDVRCDPGELSVQCEGTCNVDAYCEGSATVGVACEAECQGECTGTCSGTCKGTCEGTCMGATDEGGRCDGTCMGTCTGECSANLH